MNQKTSLIDDLKQLRSVALSECGDLATKLKEKQAYLAGVNRAIDVCEAHEAAKKI
jgi:hypothetical protein